MSFVVLSAIAAPAQTLAGPKAPPSALFPLDHFWSLALDAPFAAPLAVDERHVYIPLQTGRFMAIEPGRTEPAWAVELAAEGAPIAAAGRVFVPAAGTIQALDAATGAVAWRLPLAGKLAAPIAHRAGWLIVASADGALQAVRASDGAVMWAQDMRSPLATAASIDGNQLAVALADARIVLMDLATGKIQWERSLRSRASALTLSGDRLFFGSEDGTFVSLKTRSVDVDWPWSLGGRLVGPAAVDADRVYVIAVDNVVRGLRRSSGNVAWTRPLSTRALDGPVVIDGIVVVTTGAVGTPGLTYINALTGAAAGNTPPLEKVDETNRVQFPVAISGGGKPFAVLATASTSGNWQIHAFRQTFLTATTGFLTHGKRHEIIWRLEYRVGGMVWGEPVNLVPPVPRVP